MSGPRRAFVVSAGLAVGVSFTACGSGFLDGISGGVRDAGQTAEGKARVAVGCDAAASFCDDFDLDPLGKKWTDSGVTPGASISLADAHAFSAPFAFRAGFDGGVQNTVAELAKSIGGRTRIVCELELQLLDTPGAGEVDYLAFTTNVAGFNLYKLYFALVDGTWNLGEYGLYPDGGKIDRYRDLSSPPPINRWTHVRFETDGAAHTLTISFDGAPPAATMSSLAEFFSDSRDVHIGISFASENATTTAALYDDVTCDWL